MKWAIAAAVLGASTFLSAGCGTGDPPVVGPDGDVEPDAGGGGGNGIALRFASEQDLGAEWTVDGRDFLLTGMDVDLRDVRLIGDAASGEDDTLLELASLSWSADPATRSFRFPQAPPGRYSRIRARMTRFALEGEMSIDDKDAEVEIKSDRSIDIEIAMNEMLEPGNSLSLAVICEPSAATEGLSLDDAEIEEEDDDELEVEIKGNAANDVAQAWVDGLSLEVELD